MSIFINYFLLFFTVPKPPRRLSLRLLRKLLKKRPKRSFQPTAPRTRKRLLRPKMVRLKQKRKQLRPKKKQLKRRPKRLFQLTVPRPKRTQLRPRTARLRPRKTRTKMVMKTVRIFLFLGCSKLCWERSVNFRVTFWCLKFSKKRMQKFD